MERVAKIKMRMMKVSWIYRYIQFAGSKIFNAVYCTLLLIGSEGSKERMMCTYAAKKHAMHDSMGQYVRLMRL